MRMLRRLIFRLPKYIVFPFSKADFLTITPMQSNIGGENHPAREYALEHFEVESDLANGTISTVTWFYGNSEEASQTIEKRL